MGNMLAIEISPRVIRAVEYTPGERPVRIHRAAVTERPGGEPAAVGQFLRGFLEPNGFTAKSAVVGYLGPVIEHRIFAIPPVTGRRAKSSCGERSRRRRRRPWPRCGDGRGHREGAGAGVRARRGDDALRAGLRDPAARVPPRRGGLDARPRRLHPPGPHGAAPGRCRRRAVRVPPRGTVALRDIRLRRREAALLAGVRAGTARPRLGGNGGTRLQEHRLRRKRVCRAARGSLRRRGPRRAPGHGAHPLAPLLPPDLPRGEHHPPLLERGSAGRGGETAHLRAAEVEIAAHPAAGVSAFEGEAAFDARSSRSRGDGRGGVGDRPSNLLPAVYLQRKERMGSYIAVAVILAVFLLANAGLYMGLRNAEKRYRDVLGGAAAPPGAWRHRRRRSPAGWRCGARSRKCGAE